MKLTTAFADIRVRMSGHLYDVNINRSADSWDDVRSVFGALVSTLSTSGHFNEFHLELSGPDHGIDVTRRYGHSHHLSDLFYGVLSILPKTPKAVAALPAPVESPEPAQVAEPILPAVVTDQATAAAEALFQSFSAELEPDLVVMHAGLRNGNGHSAHTKIDTAPAPEVAVSETAPICEACKQPKIKGKGRQGWYCRPCQSAKVSAGMRKRSEERAGIPTVHTVDPRASRATLSDLAVKDAVIPAVPLTLSPAAAPSHILDLPAEAPWNEEIFQNAVVTGIATPPFLRSGFTVVKLLGQTRYYARNTRSLQPSDTVIACVEFNKTFGFWTAQPEFGGQRYRIPQEWISNAKN